MKLVLIVLAWAFLVTLVTYLWSMTALVVSLKRDQKIFWQSVGNPSISDPNGQIIILKTVFFRGRIPSEINRIYSKQLLAARSSGALGISLFTGLLLLMLL